MAETCDIGIIGAGVMGGNLALNLLRRGFSVLVYDRDEEKLLQFQRQAAGTSGEVARTLSGLIFSLSSPRRILLQVPAGTAVESLLDELWAQLDPGDVVIDGGNTNFQATARRSRDMEEKGIHFLGMGVSGGSEGALTGPCLMAGGSRTGYDLVAPILEAIAARAGDGTPCTAYVGPGGAGHFLKSVHNGIEYGDVEIVGEAWLLLKQLAGLPPQECSRVFAGWCQGPLDSYLLNITARILCKQDPETGRPMVDMVKDHAVLRGTGTWINMIALEMGIPVPTIAAALYARNFSAYMESRSRVQEQLPPIVAPPPDLDREEFASLLARACLVAKLCVYAQGVALIRAVYKAHGWPLDLAMITGLWRAGCVIRSAFLEQLSLVFARTPDLPSIFLAPEMAQVLQQDQEALRRVVELSVRAGLPTPALTSALTYLDGYRSGNLPTNLLQAQRDYYGDHTLERTDRPGVVTIDWESLDNL